MARHETPAPSIHSASTPPCAPWYSSDRDGDQLDRDVLFDQHGDGRAPAQVGRPRLRAAYGDAGLRHHQPEQRRETDAAVAVLAVLGDVHRQRQAARDQPGRRRAVDGAQRVPARLEAERGPVEERVEGRRHRVLRFQAERDAGPGERQVLGRQAAGGGREPDTRQRTAVLLMAPRGRIEAFELTDPGSLAREQGGRPASIASRRTTRARFTSAPATRWSPARAGRGRARIHDKPGTICRSRPPSGNCHPSWKRVPAPRPTATPASGISTPSTENRSLRKNHPD